MYFQHHLNSLKRAEFTKQQERNLEQLGATCAQLCLRLSQTFSRRLIGCTSRVWRRSAGLFPVKLDERELWRLRLFTQHHRETESHEKTPRRVFSHRRDTLATSRQLAQLIQQQTQLTLELSRFFFLTRCSRWFATRETKFEKWQICSEDSPLLTSVPL